MRIGLITIQSANYGSILQMWALYKSVEELGHSCTVINYAYPTAYHLTHAIGNENCRSQNLLNPRVIIRKIRSLYKKIIVRRIRKNYPNDSLQESFYEFMKQCQMTPALYDKDSIIQNPPHFEIYLTGSDQVWNPRYYHRDYSFLLNFTRPNDVRVSYASSFGARDLLPQYREDYSRYLKRYSHVSVRERSGIELFKRLTGGGKAVYCLDPTMLLTKEMWRQYSTHNLALQQEKYILCYIQTYAFDPYPYADRLIKRVQHLTGYKVKIITKDIFEQMKGYEVQYNVGPREFLDLYDNASFVIACSFHAIVFSLIMRKPFFAIMNDKPSLDDRQANIIEEFGLQSRTFRKGDILPGIKNLPLDFTEIESRIDVLRASSLNYLKSILQ